jgi:uncharacterized protein with HEPN domain
MKDPKGDKARLLHILDAISEIEDYTQGLDFEGFFRASMPRFASIKQLEIIGEAANHLTEEIIENYPDVEWRRIIALRNILIHEYFGVDAKIIWDIIKEDIPNLKLSIEIILAVFEKD